MVTDLTVKVQKYEETVTEHAEKIHQIHRVLAERESEIAQLNEKIREKSDLVECLLKSENDLKQQIVNLKG